MQRELSEMKNELSKMTSSSPCLFFGLCIFILLHIAFVFFIRDFVSFDLHAYDEPCTLPNAIDVGSYQKLKDFNVMHEKVIFLK